MSQAPANWQSMLADEEQWSDGSDLYVLASDDDPYGHYEVLTSDSECDTEDDMPELTTDSTITNVNFTFTNMCQIYHML